MLPCLAHLEKVAPSGAQGFRQLTPPLCYPAFMRTVLGVAVRMKESKRGRKSHAPLDVSWLGQFGSAGFLSREKCYRCCPSLCKKSLFSRLQSPASTW